MIDAFVVDVAVVDVQMPVSGLDALAEIRRRELPVRVLLLTAFADGESIQAALQYGAEGFALKTESPNQTIEAIRQVAQGRLVFPRTAQRWMSQYRSSAVEGPDLSQRELEVLEKLAKGRVRLATRVSNQAGELVVDGEAEVLAPREALSIELPELPPIQVG